MNGFSWFPEARTIWAMPRGHRPQGVEHGHGHSLRTLELIFQQSCWKNTCRGCVNNEWFKLLPLQIFFFNLAETPIPGASSGWPWSRPNPWGLWPLGMAQMVLAFRNQLKPFIIMILYSFCFSIFTVKSNLGPSGSVLDHALLLEVYGLWAWPRWFWPPETNSNHSLL